MTRMGTFPRAQVDPSLVKELVPLWNKAVKLVEDATGDEMHDGLMPLVQFAFEFLSGDEDCGVEISNAISLSEMAVAKVDYTDLHIPDTYIPAWVTMARHIIRFRF